MSTAFSGNKTSTFKSKDMEEGYSLGETCNRDGCAGIIKEHDTDSCCSCHNNAPCSHCTTAREYCPECNWDAEEEQRESYVPYVPTTEEEARWAADRKKQDEYAESWRRKWIGEEEVLKIETRHESHTHFSQIINGVYPKSMPDMGAAEWIYENHYNKYFGGGRWNKYPSNGTFSWIQYTD